MNTAVEPKTEWRDKKGESILVLAIDNEDGSVEIEWPNIKKRGIRVVSIKQFLSQAVPVSSNDEPVKEVDSKPAQVRQVWINESPSNLGKSPNLQLSNQDWLERGMHAKTVKFNIGAGGLPPEVNWEDNCAAVAMIDDAPAKALASILLWGSDTNWDWSRHFDELVLYLAAQMVSRCNKDGRLEPKSCPHSLPELARLMARMVLYFELYDLWDVYTVKGRLQFCGIEINPSTYTNAWLTYQRQMTHDIFDMVGKVDCSVSHYRRQLSEAD